MIRGQLPLLEFLCFRYSRIAISDTFMQSCDEQYMYFRAPSWCSSDSESSNLLVVQVKQIANHQEPDGAGVLLKTFITLDIKATPLPLALFSHPSQTWLHISAGKFHNRFPNLLKASTQTIPF